MAKTNISDREWLQIWEDFAENVKDSAPVDKKETPEAKRKRMAKLEAPGNDEEWFRYYFAKFYTSEPAQFHKRATKRIMNNPEWYEVRAWSRELSKSTRTMMEILKLVLTGKKSNVLMVSNSWDNAVELLQPYKVMLESNPRIINDYGTQERPGSWKEGKFTTRYKVSFRAVGADQSPRGTKKLEKRPDVILIDDLDTDKDCRNPEIIKYRWNWVEQSLIGTRSISNPMLIIFCGNIIAKYCCITEAIKKADHSDIINIRDNNGKSSWPQKNSEAQIDRALSKISYISAQKEYYNNPIDEGSVFKEMAYKPARHLKEYSMLVCYTDPSFKDSKKNDYKATVLVGKWRDEFHIIKAFVEQTTTAKMIEWHYDIMDFVGEYSCYYLMEQVFLQDILMKEFYEEGRRRGRTIPIAGDVRVKIDKFTRIESLLEPLNRNGKLYLNENEKNNAHMVRLEDQFKAIAPGSRAHDDAPDAVEGAVWYINGKEAAKAVGGIQVFKRPSNSKRF